MEEEIKIPNTLEECYIELDNMMPIDASEWLGDTEKNALAKAHHGLGQWLRNNWGLWSESELKTHFEGLGLYHADDMSGVILTSYHRHKNNKEICLEEQVQHYKDFWAKNKFD